MHCEELPSEYDLVIPIASNFAYKSGCDVDDLKQIGYISVLKARNNGHTEPAYLKTAIRNDLIKYTYKQRIPSISIETTVGEGITVGDTLCDSSIDVEQDADLKQRMDRLTPLERKTVKMRLNGDQIRTIASELKLKTQTVINTLRDFTGRK